jgi:hypothetical protein
MRRRACDLFPCDVRQDIGSSHALPVSGQPGGRTHMIAHPGPALG